MAPSLADWVELLRFATDLVADLMFSQERADTVQK